MATYHQGIVRSTSLMPNGLAFDDAVEISRSNPGLGVGIHISLVGERCLAPAGELGGLAAADGRLPVGFAEFLKLFVAGRFSVKHIRREVDAQVKRVLDAGIRPTHIDSHQHLHVFPGVLDAVLDAATLASIPVVRVPRETRSISARGMERLFLNTCCKLAMPKIRRTRLSHTRHFWGFGVSGSMTERNLTEIINRLRPGVNEIMCHPGYADAATAMRYEWGYNWDIEAEALCSSAVIELLKNASVRLSSFVDPEINHWCPAATHSG